MIPLKQSSPLAFAIILLASVCRAATVQTLDPAPISGTIAALDHDTLTINRKGAQPVKIPLENILDISISWEDRQTPTTLPAVPKPPAATSPATAPATRHAAATTQKKPMLWRADFIGGDRLTATLSDWTDAHVTFNLDALKGTSITLPANSLRALWSDDSFAAIALVKKARDLHIAEQAQDVAFVQKDGDVKAVAGLVTSLDDSSLHFKFEGEDHTIKLDRLVGIVFAQREAVPVPGLYQTFTLMNDDVISAHINALTDGSFEIVPSAQVADAHPTLLPLSALTKIETRNGRQMWVSDMTPLSVSQAPYFDHLMPYQINHSLTGGPLRLIDGTVAKGIAVHARCILSYDIAGQYDTFRTKLGFQQPEGKLAAPLSACSAMTKSCGRMPTSKATPNQRFSTCP